MTDQSSDKDPAAQFRDYFTPDEHELRPRQDGENWVIWSVYIRREAITKRLDDMFGPFGWEFQVGDPLIEGKVVTHQGAIVINERRRDNNGGSTMGGDENAIKASLTDCFKRCASSWGIGLYLQNTPTIFTNGGIRYTEGPRKGKTDNKKQAAAEKEARPLFEKWLKSLMQTTATKPVSAEQAKDTLGQGKFTGTDKKESAAPPEFDHDMADDSMLELPKVTAAQAKKTLGNGDRPRKMETRGKVTASYVDLRKDQQGKLYMVTEVDDHKYFTWTRQPFRDAGILCEHWDTEGKRYTFPEAIIHWEENNAHMREIKHVDMLAALEEAS